MKKQHALIVLVLLLITAFTVTMSVVFLTSPSPFSAIVEQEKTPSTTRKTADDLIDINSADIDELMSLPDMTRDMALSIIEYREIYRRFNVPTDLLKVDGIDEELVEAWKPYICCK